MKKILLIILLCVSTNVFGQIRIEDVGDGWKHNVERALDTIKKYDVEKYVTILEVCKHITFWNGNVSTTEDSVTVMISQRDMLSGNIQNIAAVIVHESYHLDILKYKIKLDVNQEEYFAYGYEYSFLVKIPNVDVRLLEHDLKMMKFYKNNLEVQK